MSLPAIVLVHNRYREAGGEDVVFEQEAALLEERGHVVARVEASNDDVPAIPRGRLAARLFWSRGAARAVADAVARVGARVAHFHNTLPLISPAAYYSARRAGAAVVQTLHNYRLVCPGGLLLRDGRPCEDCVGSPLAWKGVVHRCYRGSRVDSAGVATMVAAHRLAGTWENQVDAYIALGGFSRDRFIAGGLPPDRVHVRPNFLGEDPGTGEHGGDHALFVGRLSEEKGVRALLEAWRSLDPPLPLRIIGEGALGPAEVGTAQGVEWLGGRPRAEVIDAMKRARVLVFPSISYENFPMTVLEAFATGLPVLASRTGSLPSIVEEGRTGYLFEPGSPDSLAAAVRRAWRERERLPTMGAAARKRYEARYDRESGYSSLVGVYERAIEHYEGTWHG